MAISRGEKAGPRLDKPSGVGAAKTPRERGYDRFANGGMRIWLRVRRGDKGCESGDEWSVRTAPRGILLELFADVCRLQSIILYVGASVCFEFYWDRHSLSAER